MKSDSAATIAIKLNGKEAELPAGQSITDLIASRDLKPQMVVVEINGTIVARASFAETLLESGDEVEIVHFVGGGE
jgi:thiamine biosynthesis protein ThiS